MSPDCTKFIWRIDFASVVIMRLLGLNFNVLFDLQQ